MAASNNEIHSLHRYFIWADRMRVHFDDHLVQSAEAGTRKPAEMDIEFFLYGSYWYSGMYVVVEGWKELGLSDPKVDALIQSPLLDTLRRFRNGAFHFQKEYWDTRFTDFFGAGAASAKWIRELREALSSYFLDHFKKVRESKQAAAPTS